jgi:hypothetical protein
MMMLLLSLCPPRLQIDNSGRYNYCSNAQEAFVGGRA